MAPIKNVAVIGASGNLGKYVTPALVKAGFNVTALTRADSTSTFPSGVTVKKVDYSNLDSVTTALQGQDAVVSLAASNAIAAQKLVVDAALAAGVQRFIPSEFGINTQQVAGQPIGKILSAKVALQEYLGVKATGNKGFSWTGISTGNFFDWVLKLGGTGIEFDTKTVTVVDSGDEKFYTSNLSYIGQGVAAVLSQPDKTANKFLLLASFNTSQNEIVSLVEELTNQRFERKTVKSADIQKAGEEKLAKGDFSAFRDLLKVWTQADGAGHALEEEDNAARVLGLPEENVRDAVTAWLKETGKL